MTEYIPVPCVTCGQLVADADRCANRLDASTQHHSRPECCDPVKAWEVMYRVVLVDD